MQSRYIKYLQHPYESLKDVYSFDDNEMGLKDLPNAYLYPYP